MTENINVPSRDQIEAAQELYGKMEYWQLQDKILAEFRAKDPNLTDQGVTLVKATLINAFYGARCSVIDAITSWIVDQNPGLLECYKNIGSSDDERIKLVQRIALYGRNSTADGYIVFASKFAHFFIDAEAIPIYDRYARMMVDFYIDSLDEGNQRSSKYGVFYKKFHQMKQQLEQRDAVTYATKKIDHFLWLAGQYIALKKGIKRTIYEAARLQFKDPNNQHLLDNLFPEEMLAQFPQKSLDELLK